MQALPIGSKLNRLVIFSVVVALLAITTWSAFETYMTEKERMRQMLTNYVTLIGLNSQNTLAEGKPHQIIPLLNSLENIKGVKAAVVYDVMGRVLASNLKSSYEAPKLPDHWRDFSEEGNYFHAYRNILSEDGKERLGVVYLQYNYEQLYGILLKNLAYNFLAAILAILITIVFSRRLKRSITRPIVELSRATQQVITHKDYTIRVNRHAEDEVGELSDAFNEMLLQVQVRDTALAQTHTDLERRVAARTKELMQAKEEAEKATRIKADFMASMSHEIRTPMNGVIGMSQLLETTSLDQSQLDLLATLQSSASSLMQIINDILDFSKIEAGMLSLEYLPFNLKETLNQVHDILLFKAKEKGIYLKTDIQSDLPIHLIGDASRIRQVMLNFISNAIKFTETGGVLVSVTGQVIDNEVALKFEVSDSGIGIPDDKLEHVFDKFIQADTSTTRKFGGTGLGLSISRQLAKLMNGEVFAESNLGEGSSFYLLLTLAVDEQADAKNISQGRHEVPNQLVSDERKVNDLSQCRILLVEDNLINQKVSAKMLDKIGCSNVDMAVNGELAIEKVKSNQYDLIFMDCHMPVCDGYEATQRIRHWESQQPSGNMLPIIALTANAMEGEKDTCLASGMNDYLSKPVGIPDFELILKKYYLGLANLSE